MKNLYQYLSPINVALSDLLLDPNNPRFSELGEEVRPIPEGRFAEEKVQRTAFDKMKTPAFDVQELRDTIRALGFLQMDRLVIRPWKGGVAEGVQKYVVIEGNRRVTAIRWLLDLHSEGKETLSEAQLNNMQTLECLLLDDKNAPDTAQIILPGLRHVSGIKEWGPYQKAKAVFALRETGMSPQEVAQSLGLSTRAANTAYRCFMALEQMKADEEFGEYAEPKMYSYFEEIFKKRNVKDRLGWDENSYKFGNESSLIEFYSWIVPGSDEEEAKLPKAVNIRELSIFIDDPAAVSIFRSKDGSLSRALARYELDHPADWFPQIAAAVGAIRSLTPDKLRHLDGASIQSLTELREAVEQALEDRSKLLA
jgi:hypothetical protein